MKLLLSSTILALTLGLSCAQSKAADDYPAKPVTMVIPYAPGGSSDPLGRFIADGLQAKWEKPVVIENKAGAGSTLGTGYVARAKPDGYTMLFTSAAMTTAPAIFASLPYDTDKDLAPVALVAYSPYLVVSSAKLGISGVAGLKGLSEQRPLFLATAGLGSSAHFAGELFAAASGLRTKAVHYKGSSEAMLDIIGGRADLYVGSVTAAADTVKAKQAQAIAVVGSERSALLPEIPTTTELGLPTTNAQQWFGVFFPADTPEDVIAKVNSDINELMSSDKGKEFAAKFGSAVNVQTPAEFKEFVTKDIEAWAKLAAERGIKAQ